MHRIPTLWGNFIAEPFVIICKSSFVGKNTRSSWFALLQLISFRLQISYIMGNFSNGEKPTIWGTSHIKKSYIMGKSKKKFDIVILQFGELLFKEPAFCILVSTKYQIRRKQLIKTFKELIL